MMGLLDGPMIEGTCITHTLYEVWRAGFESETVELTDILPRRVKYYQTPAGTFGWWCECLCGGNDHWGWFPMVREGFSEFPSGIFQCYETDRQWLVRMPNVEAVIRSEEEKYLKLIEKAPAIIAKAQRHRSGEDLLGYLEDTHGIDRELALSIIG